MLPAFTANTLHLTARGLRACYHDTQLPSAHCHPFWCEAQLLHVPGSVAVKTCGGALAPFLPVVATGDVDDHQQTLPLLQPTASLPPLRSAKSATAIPKLNQVLQLL